MDARLYLVGGLRRMSPQGATIQWSGSSSPMTAGGARTWTQVRLTPEQNGIMVRVLPLTQDHAMAQETLFICQPYVAGKRGGLKPMPPIAYKTEAQATLRAHRMMTAAGVVGVDVVHQTADPDMGDYDEPVFLQRLGSVPTADN
jgi:hypothetical protein